MSTSAPWTIGQSVNITWSTYDYLDPDLNPLSNVKIELQRDGGIWELIIASTSNTGTYIWSSVTGPSTQNAILRISDPIYGIATGQSIAFIINAVVTTTVIYMRSTGRGILEGVGIGIV